MILVEASAYFRVDPSFQNSNLRIIYQKTFNVPPNIVWEYREHPARPSGVGFVKTRLGMYRFATYVAVTSVTYFLF